MQHARFLSFALLAFLCASEAFAQPETSFDSSRISQVEYTRLDHLEKDRANLLGGSRAQVEFNLIELRNLSTDQVVRGVEVNVSKEKTETAGGSIGLAAVGSLFGASSSITYRRIQNSGYIFLPADDLSEVVSFMNSVVGALGRKQDQMKIWKVSIQEGFELGMMYDPSDAISDAARESAMDRPGWKFIVTASEATYRLPYKDGLEVIETFSSWRDRLKER